MAYRGRPRVKPTITTSGRITKEELEQKGGSLPSGPGHWIRKELKTLQVGEMLFVSRNDWNWQLPNSPARIANDLNRRTHKEFVTSVLRDGSGWVIERVK